MTKTFRLVLVLFAFGLGAWGLYPSIWWYGIAAEEQKNLANMSRGTLAKYLRAETEADVKAFQSLVQADPQSEELPEELIYIQEVAEQFLLDRKQSYPDSWSLENIGRVFGGREQMRSKLEDYWIEKVLEYRARKQSSLKLGLDLNGGQSVMIRPEPEDFEQKLQELSKGNQDASLSSLRALLQQRVVESLQSRVDQFGLSEPEIHSFQDGRIEVVIPGQGQGENVEDDSAIDSFLQGKGSLVFRFVDEEETERLIEYLNRNPEKAGELAQGADLEDYDVPAGSTIAGVYQKDKYGMDRLRGFQVLESDVVLDGGDIIGARIGRTSLGQWEVQYTLNQEGATKTQKIFTNDAGRIMAIVLDGRVLSSPRISVNNAGNFASSYNQGSITGDFTVEEAKELANVLNSGSLPVKLVVESRQIVGPSLGRASIEAGLIGIAVGLLAVVLFMFLYYRGAGLIADAALLLNLFFLLAVLATMKSTLTLTGIAGIILTIGMSVDANVIIYERIKEELRMGKKRKAAIATGFSRAFWTIFDANVTTGIAAFFLALFGNGSVRGFAITLAWGITCSLFTALFIARLIFDFNTDVLRLKKLTIMWRRVEG